MNWHIQHTGPAPSVVKHTQGICDVKYEEEFLKDKFQWDVYIQGQNADSITLRVSQPLLTQISLDSRIGPEIRGKYPYSVFTSLYRPTGIENEMYGNGRIRNSHLLYISDFFNLTQFNYCDVQCRVLGIQVTDITIYYLCYSVFDRRWRFVVKDMFKCDVIFTKIIIAVFIYILFNKSNITVFDNYNLNIRLYFF